VSSTDQTARRPRVLLADDHMETAKQLRTLLESDFDVVGVVEDGRALVSAAARLLPDVIVADISMPELDGIDATALLRRNNPQARVVLVTVHAEPMLVQRGLAAGALGYVLKDAAGDDLVTAVHAALDGQRYVSRSLGHQEHEGRPD
jgi:DNA-binding NarL/FixJ family response regulator